MTALRDCVSGWCDTLTRSNNYQKRSGISLCGQLALMMCALLGGSATWGQAACTQGDVNCKLPAPGEIAPALPTGRPGALVDLTGQWVSVVTEDWRFRMVTPPKGDYESMPINGVGRQLADAWNPEADRTKDACMAYGAAAIMRMPGRFRISWEGDDVLMIESDAGKQVRHLNFSKSSSASGPATRQGVSKARWLEEGLPQGKTKYGTLKVVTTQLLPGYLRKNGVPVSGNAVVTEYFDRFTTQNGDDWLVVTTIVDDPEYLSAPYTTSTHLKLEPNRAGWHPAPCLPGNPSQVVRTEGAR